ncbi:WXG100-like domain-containing protein [Streptomyces beijiangensis]|uniref:PE-PGRS family protein n=1 Tax=Streptomyces beijiangensis TaxID=163361 RepID=A0A939F2D6_9ACTN|nr:PE-PGRS family protein [Streptomyces beijiangensis]MBO0511266.1 PE-PGRS family protein [Streptomyces beijiangensis]
MSLMLPGEIAWVLGLLGYEWPEADEDKIVQTADAWRAFGAEVGRLEEAGMTAAGAIRAANSGDATEAFDKEWQKYAGDGYLGDAKFMAETLAIALDVVAVNVVISKVTVIAQLVALAFEIAAAQAAAPFTFGLSEAGAVGATQITRVIVRRVLDELEKVIVETITKTLKEASLQALKDMVKQAVTDAAKEAATGMAQNLVEQGVKVNFGAQSGFDLKGAASEGLDTFKESATTGIKDGLTGVKENIEGLADPRTYLQAATDRAGEHAGNGLNHLAGGGGPDAAAEQGSGSDAAEPANSGTSSGTSPGSGTSSDTSASPSASPSASSGSGSHRRSPHADRVRSDFG